ncbi:MAG TPA: hypothetical protein VEI98_06600, partial [Xanthobacteraceae bacterium]|nr:hypothetical protein [Xanthobacteraceae bacterium]
TGPRDVIGNNPIGVLNEDLRAACMQALWISRESCREFALRYSWENSARQFIAHARKVAVGAVDESEMPPYVPEAAPDSGAQSLVPDKARISHEHSL